MTELIVAMDKSSGIGVEGKLPWNIKEELDIFRRKTFGKTIVCGRKTAQSIPCLQNRDVICITRDTTAVKNHNPVIMTSNIESIPDDSIIAGGSQIYKLALLGNNNNRVKKVHISILNDEYKCDTFFDLKWLRGFVIVSESKFEKFTHYTLERMESGEHKYLELMGNILEKGESRIGRNGETISFFKNDITFDLRQGFPLLTTKKMFLRGILEEFLFFLRGDTDSTYLNNKNVRIWEHNTTNEFIKDRGLPYAEGVMGPMYGYQWRFFNAKYELDSDGRPLSAKGGKDQLENVIYLIKNDPLSRRILLTTYNPEQAEQGVLYPCHSITIQFYVSGEYLDMFCYNRSQDVFLGVPFNIASQALLLITIAEITDKKPRFFHMTMGDTHIYAQHLNQVKEQINRIPYKFPDIITPKIDSLVDIYNLKPSDYSIKNYFSHPRIKAEMVA